MDERLLITCDSGVDIGMELAKQYQIKILPLNVKLGKQYLQDGINVSSQDLFDYFNKTKDIAVTSSPTIDQTFQFFTRHVFMGYTIIHFTISAELSESYANAIAAANDIGRNVHVVDTRTGSSASALVVLTAARMAQENKPLAEILSTVHNLTAKTSANVLVDKMDFLYAGGRCNGFQRFGANLFNIHPCIVVKEGKLVQDGTYRGKQIDIIPKFVEDALAKGTIDNHFAFLTHTGVSQSLLDKAHAELEKRGKFDEIFTVTTGCTISAHLGPNTICVMFLFK
ncbi:MAG TPA: hypothetical protein DCO72_02875 [Ruminococcus sp.]|nr:hypothetical protein [Ruminococcus sp.]